MTVREVEAEMQKRFPDAPALDVKAAVIAVLSNSELGRYSLAKVEERVRAVLNGTR